MQQTALVCELDVSVGRLRGATDPANPGKASARSPPEGTASNAINKAGEIWRLTRPQGRGESSQCHAKYSASDKLGNWRICAEART